MTPEEETVIKEPARKKTRRQTEMTALADRVLLMINNTQQSWDC